MNVELTEKKRRRRTKPREPTKTRMPNFEKRLAVKSLEALAELFKDNPRALTQAELSEKSGVAPRTIRELLSIHYRRPDLVARIFADDLSIYKAVLLVKAEPEKWIKGPRTRRSAEEMLARERKRTALLDSLLGECLQHHYYDDGRVSQSWLAQAKAAVTSGERLSDSSPPKSLGQKQKRQQKRS